MKRVFNQIHKLLSNELWVFLAFVSGAAYLGSGIGGAYLGSRFGAAATAFGLIMAANLYRVFTSHAPRSYNAHFYADCRLILSFTKHTTDSDLFADSNQELEVIKDKKIGFKVITVHCMKSITLPHAPMINVEYTKYHNDTGEWTGFAEKISCGATGGNWNEVHELTYRVHCKGERIVCDDMAKLKRVIKGIESGGWGIPGRDNLQEKIAELEKEFPYPPKANIA